MRSVGPRGNGGLVARALTLAAIVLLVAAPAVAQSAHPRDVFGPEQFTRTTGGHATFYIRTVTVPSFVTGPFTLHVQNGAPDGSHRSFGAILVDGAGLIPPILFGPHQTSIDRTVSLGATNTLFVSVGGTSGAFIVITISGTVHTGSLATPRSGHSATALADGGVLVTGGRDVGGALASMERFDPSTRQFAPLGATLREARAAHAASVLANRVHMLVAGQDAGGFMVSSELIDPAAGTSSTVDGALPVPRAGHTATVLTDGRVLVVGGFNPAPLGDVDVFDPQATLLFTPAFDPRSGSFTTLPAALATPRWDHTATLLPDGRVLIAGGRDAGGPLSSVEIFDPAAATFLPAAGALTSPRAGHTATLMPDGTVLFLGGDNATGPLASAERYTPATGLFTVLARPLVTPRTKHTATLLRFGEVVVIGGENASGILASTELYGPPVADATAPRVVDANIEDSETGVDLTEIIGLRFSEPVDVTTVTSSTVTLAHQGQTVAATVSPSEHGLLAFLVPVSPLAPGTTYTVHATAGVRDTAGNALTPFTMPFTTVPVPSITTVTPSHGVIGATVTITGQDFDPALPQLNVVEFGGVAAEVTAATATQLTTSVPAGVTIAVATTLTVTTRGGTASSSFTVDYPVPVLTSIAPTSVVGGSSAFTLTLTGSSFVSGSSVTFGALTLTPATQSATQLTVSVPASAVAAVATIPVTVTNPTPGGGTSTARTFTVFVPPPTIATVVPSRGVAGSPVVITGTDFNAAAAGNQVRFNGTVAVVASATPTSIQTSVPVGAPVGVGAVTVTTASGVATAPFSVDNPGPTLSAIAPDSVLAGSAAFTLTITGTSFVATSTVNFGGATLVPTTRTATQLEVTVPAAAVASPMVVQVSVANPGPGGGTSGAEPFTIINPAPTITGFTPTSGLPGTPVTVTGTTFERIPSRNQVRFNGTLAAVLSATTTSLQTVVPVGATTGPISIATPGGTATSTAPFTVTLSQDFALTVSPGETSVVAGDQISFALSATATNGFSGIIAVGVPDAPAGITVTVAAPPGGINAPLPMPTIAAGGLAYVTLGVAASVPVGRYPFTVVGTTTIDGQTITRSTVGAVQVVERTGTSISGRVLTVLDQPLGGVQVSMDGHSTFTDAAGNFGLGGVQPGSQRTFKVDGRTVQDPQHRYPDVTQLIDVAANQNTRLPFITYLPALSPFETPINPAVETIVTNPEIPNLQVIVPRGTTITKEGQPVTALSITPVPIERAPMPLPADWTVGQLFAVQPGGAVPSQPVPIVYPNTLGAPPGSRMQLFFASHTTGVWEIYGEGTVSQDGLRIIPDPGVGQTQLAWGGGLIAVPPPWLLAILLTLLADPVIAQTGQASVSVVDLELPGRMPVLIERSYRSPENGFFRNVGMTRLGPRWILRGWDDTLTVNGQTMAYIGDFGQAIFSQQADGTYANTAPAMRGITGTARTDGSAQLRLKDGTVLAFDALGQLVQRRDRNGNVVTVVRTSAFGPVTEIREPAGRAIRLEYDERGRLSRVSDPIGRTVGYDYDAAGFLSTVTDPKGGTTRYTYDGVGRMLMITDARNITYLTNVYDGLGRVVSQQAADGGVTTFDYFTSGTQVTETTITDPLGHLTTYRYDGQGNLTTTIDALGQTTHIVRDYATALVDHIIDPLNRITRLTYNGAGNVTSVTDPAGNTTLIEYEPTFNKVTKITNPQVAGEPVQTWRFEYDERGNLRTTRDPLDTATTMTYDAVGQPFRITDAANNTLQLDYDSHGNVVRVTDRLGNQSTITYDGVSRVLAQTDPSGRSLALTFDELNRLTTMTDAAGTTAFTYDANSNLRTLTDARGKTTSYEYDAMDQLTSRMDALGGTETLTYDLAGNVRTHRDRKSQTTTYAYDALNRLREARFADGTRSTLAYDGGGRLVQVLDTTGGATSFAVDVLDRVVAEVGPLGAVSYQYDVLSRRTSLQVPGAPPTTYAYDLVDRLIGVTQGAQSVTIDRDAIGRRRGISYSNGLNKEYQYDEASRLVALIWRHATTVLGDLRYDYDRAGARTRVSGSFARTRVPDAVSAAAYDDLNRQTTFGDDQMTYDANGLLTSRTGPAGSRVFAWDTRDRLVSVTDGGRTGSFAYDALGRRGAKTIDGATTEYLYDGLDVAAAFQDNDAKVFLRSLQLDETFSFTGRDGTYFSIYDPLGSTVALTSQDGAVAVEYTYGPFGETTASAFGFDNAFQFTGRENDDIADLYYYRARYYSPSLHRFLSPDPIGVFSGDPNVYRYVFDDPTNLVDPTGEFAFAPVLVGATLACASGAAMNGGASLLFGRKPFLKAASGGCIESVLFHGAGKVLGAAARWAKSAVGRTANAARSGGGLGPGDKPGGGGVDASVSGGGGSGPGPGGPGAGTPSGGGGGGGRRRIGPDPSAEGPHSTFKRDPVTGKITRYETHEPQSNPRNPNPWERVKSYDASGRAHYNKETQQWVPAPHVQSPRIPGGVRPAEPWEMPR